MLYYFACYYSAATRTQIDGDPYSLFTVLIFHSSLLASHLRHAIGMGANPVESSKTSKFHVRKIADRISEWVQYAFVEAVNPSMDGDVLFTGPSVFDDRGAGYVSCL